MGQFLMLGNEIVAKGFNVTLRFASLGAKLILTLYMVRYFDLAEMGIYGLVFAAVAICSALLGFQLDYVVSRDLVGASPKDSLCKIKDQAAFYSINYVFFGLVMLGAYSLGIASGKILLAVYALSVMENFSGIMGGNLVAMGRPVLSTFLAFVRYGLWGLIAVALGFLDETWRHVDWILLLWAGGEALAILINAVIWRHLPWREALRVKVDWQWIGNGVKKSFLIWLGAAGSILIVSLDRFIVSFFLDMDKVGIITFYGSFANALLALIQSGFFAFASPRLVRHHREGRHEDFQKEAKKLATEVFFSVMVVAALLGVIVPAAGAYFGKPELAAEEWTFWLMLIGVWVRANADTLFYLLYARGQDRALWMGGVLVLLPSVLGNVLLVAWQGLPGVGYSAILTSLLVFGWRYKFVVGYKKNSESN